MAVKQQRKRTSENFKAEVVRLVMLLRSLQAQFPSHPVQLSFVEMYASFNYRYHGVGSSILMPTLIAEICAFF